MEATPQSQVVPEVYNINCRLASMTRRFASKEALIDPDGAWTYGQLWALSNAAAGLLSGFTQSERIGIMLPPVKEFAAAFYGTLLAGRTVVPVNFLLSKPEIGKIIADAGLEFVLTSRALVEHIGGFDHPCVYLEDLKGSLESAATRTGAPSAEALGLAADTPAVIIYTSGTAGEPKGVVLTHANLLANTDACVQALQLNHNNRLLASLPFFHVFGLTTGLVMPLGFGASTVMLPKFSIPSLVSAVKDHGVNIILTIPSIWTALVRSGTLARERLCGLDICVSGGEPLPPKTAEAFEQATGRPLMEGYGMTETSPVISLNLPEAARTGSVGRPLPRVKVRVVDEAGKSLGPDGEGEIHVAGPGVMKGYHNRPELTGQAIDAEGWLRTGDLGRFDADGYLYVTGRLKELIITGGENVNPREVEEVLLGCPGVAEVAVAGIPDETRGEVVAAFIVRTPEATLDAAEVRTFCRNHLAGYKTPRKIEFLDQLPRNYAGKLLKRKLIS